jgi:hypothetical protein
MTGDFHNVREAGAESWIGRGVAALRARFAAAWRTSRLGNALGRAEVSWTAQARAARIRWVATTISVAAVAHLAMRPLMSPTVIPAMPAVLFVFVAIGTAIVAWQAEAFERAWRQSRFARYFS